MTCRCRVFPEYTITTHCDLHNPLIGSERGEPNFIGIGEFLTASGCIEGVDFTSDPVPTKENNG